MKTASGWTTQRGGSLEQKETSTDQKNEENYFFTYASHITRKNRPNNNQLIIRYEHACYLLRILTVDNTFNKAVFWGSFKQGKNTNKQ